MIKKCGIKAVLAVVLLGLSAFLLKGDVWVFWTWWLMAGIMGMVAMPVTGRLFARFEDKGWLFSKMIFITGAGFLAWFLVSIKLLKFTAAACIGVCVVLAALCLVLFVRQTRAGVECLPVERMSLIYWEEIVFFAAFLVWTYVAGFHPAAYGTEKFMDYGFMEALMRNTELPPRDLWYSEGHINYYYGGQYFAVFLTKLSGSTVAMTYNLMRTFVAGLAAALPFSLVYQMVFHKLGDKSGRVKKYLPGFFGVLSGCAVSIAGNMHYVIYGKIVPWLQRLLDVEEVDGYWFPDATRYIGYNPDVPDKTIHEFPSYSFVLGDLHAHVVNIMFVLLVLGLLYAWMLEVRLREAIVEKVTRKRFWARQLLIPHLLLVSLLLGMFQWTNFWDFVIYFVVAGGVVLFTNIIRFQGNAKRILGVTAAQGVEVLAVSYAVILPFTLQFKTMVQGIGIAKNHTAFYQLLVLWGLPAVLVLVFIAALLAEKLWKMKNKSLYRVMKKIDSPDLFAVIMGLCALGLVLIPELVYVRDIYEEGYARANTMFKLTYQAYIMFGMTMAYVIFRLLFVNRRRLLKEIAAVGLALLVWTFGYFGNSVSAWFGDVFDRDRYQGINAAAFLETDFPADAAAIRWLKKNVEGTPVVLEANGDSYTGYERVSAMTGLPTVLGWYVHEWLWRGDTADLNEKSEDVKNIYTSPDSAAVRSLVEKYQVEYIFVGSMEREKYGEELNEGMLQALGETVFKDENSGTYIIKVS